MPAQVGALRITLGANTAQYEAGMRRAQQQARTTGQSISASLTQAQTSTTRAFAGIRTAAAAIGVALGAQAFVGYARGALEYAASLSETARQVGVTVEQLQILQRIGLENNVTNETLERSLARLNRTLGEAKAQVESAQRPFKALGFTDADLAHWRQGGDALREVAERIMRIPDPARQAAAATALMGRNGQELIPTLQAIASGYDAAAAEAMRMGLLTEEQANKADEAQDKIDALAFSLQARLAGAIADNIDPLNNLIGGLADLINVAGRAAGELERAGDRAMVAGQNFWHAVRVIMLGGNIITRHTFDQMEANARGNVNAAQARLSNAGIGDSRSVAMLQRMGRAPPRAPSGGLDYQIGRGGGGGRHGGAGDAERQRKDALRDEADFQSELRRMRIDVLREQQNQVTDATARNDLAYEILDLERQQYIAEQNLKVQLGDLTQARADQLIAAYDQVHIEQQGTLDLERQRQIEADNREIDDARYEVAADALRQEADLAETAAERREAELRLLELTYRHERAKLDEIIAAEQSTRVEVQRAQAQRDALDSRHANSREGVMRDTRGPLEEYLAGLPRTAAQANEALEAVAANGLQSITDGLADAIMMTRSWGDVFKNVAKQIIADLLRIQIQRALVSALGGSNGGGGDFFGLSGGGGGLFSSLGSLFGGNGRGVSGSASGIISLLPGIMGRASGGPVLPGRTYVVGENGPELLMMGNAGGTVVPNGRGMGIQIVPSPYFDAVVDGRVIGTGGPMVMASAVETRTGVKTDLYRRQKQIIP